MIQKMKKSFISLSCILALSLQEGVLHSVYASEEATDNGTPLASASEQYELSNTEKIVSASPIPSFEWRHHTLHSLSPCSFESGAQRYLIFLEKNQCPEGWNRDDFLSLKNDIIDLFIKNRIRINDLATQLLSVIDNSEHYIVWRDYCIQKLSSLIASGRLSPENEREAISKLDRYTAGEAPGLTGTALISAVKLIKNSDNALLVSQHLNQNTLAEYAFKCASSEEEQYIDRITALQIAAELEHPEVAAYTRSILDSRNSDVPVMFKVSSIAALGRTGSSADIPLLTSYRNSPDIRIRKATRHSMHRIYNNSILTTKLL